MRDEIVFEVEGFPPAKNEALSMLGQGHSHAPRVTALLTAARGAIGDDKQLTGPIGLDVIVYAPAGRDPWDATNYLGGIADVLEDKGRRGDLDHLGDLRSVALYANDRQIAEVHYRQHSDLHPHYRVRVWALEREN